MWEPCPILVGRARWGCWALAAAIVALTAACGSRSGSPSVVSGPLPGAGVPAFDVALEPTVSLPVQVGAAVGLRFTSSVGGFGHLYLINADGSVVSLAENWALTPGVAATFPGPGVELRASPPPGRERIILLVTVQPFAGPAASAGQPLRRPVQLAAVGGADAFLTEFARTMNGLSAGSWAATETYVQVVD